MNIVQASRDAIVTPLVDVVEMADNYEFNPLTSAKAVAVYGTATALLGSALGVFEDNTKGLYTLAFMQSATTLFALPLLNYCVGKAFNLESRVSE